MITVASEHVTLTRDGGRIRATVSYLDHARAWREVPLDVQCVGGLVHVYTDPRTDGARRPSSDGPLDGLGVCTWAMPWDQALIRLLAEPHLVFEPTDVPGRALRRWLRSPPGEVVGPVPTLGGAAVRWRVDGAPGEAEIEWIRPNAIVWRLGLGTAGEVCGRAWCVPVDGVRTRLLFTTPRGVTEPPGAAPTEVLSAPTQALIDRFRRWFLRYGARSTAGAVSVRSPRRAPAPPSRAVESC